MGRKASFGLADFNPDHGTVGICRGDEYRSDRAMGSRSDRPFAQLGGRLAGEVCIQVITDNDQHVKPLRDGC